ncbi:MAG TPA: SNF2-related protein, partial [Prolixibacteraceae bacterium]|nr:SNF2-related protein [Prolixibacteraceae bacterium]
MEKNPNPVEFVVTLTEHRVFGFILVPFLVQKNAKNTFYQIVALANPNQQAPDGFLYSEMHRQLHQLYENYTDEVLSRKFSRKSSSKEFFDTLEASFFQKHIAPYIDKQIVATIDLIEKYQILLFSKSAKYNNLHDDDRITVMTDYPRPVFHFDRTEQGLTYYLKVFYKGERMTLRNKRLFVIADTPAIILIDNCLYRFRKVSGKKLAPFFEKEQVHVPPSLTEKYLQTFVFNIVRDYEVEANGFAVEVVRKEKKALISIEQGLDLAPILVLYFQYGRKKFLAGNKTGVEVEFLNHSGRFTFLKHIRDFAWERSVMDLLQKHGMLCASSQIDFAMETRPQDASPAYARINWINNHAAELEDWGIIVVQDVKETYYTGAMKLDLALSMDGDWFDLYATVQLGTYSFPFIRLKKNILKGQREYVLPNGEVVILPEIWFVRFSELFRLGEPDSEALRFQKHHFRLLEETLKGTDPSLEERLAAYDPSKLSLIQPPVGLKATLRSYQRQGYSWMYAMSRHHFGACLADDMGLGKTLQTLALLMRLKEERHENSLQEHSAGFQGVLFPVEQKALPPSLIVVPTSLVHNWQNEMARFTPDLKVYTHIGNQRKKGNDLAALFSSYDVVLTTYGIVRNDQSLLQTIRFYYLILDESQYIKNPGSKAYQSVCTLNSEFRLVLTGTPIENSLSDLWAQMNFLNPGLVGNYSFFQNEYVQPVEKGNDEQKQSLLKKLISPFILRRRKEEVEPDLPSLTQLELFCEMEEEQQKVYEEQKSVIRNKLLEEIQKQGIKKTSFLIFQGLTRLRQLANHPKLLGFGKAGSGKFSEVMRNLEELLAENHKVLVFSSFVTHLKMFEEEFIAREWPYC